MDLAEIRLIRKVIIKERGAAVFLEKSSESPLKSESASLFFNLQLYSNLDSCGDIHCALGQLKKEEI